ncbi:peroxisomal membrane protein 4 [Sistotremastrum niveocremeum HHB9708]|uniref:Peroxisomal membrane protein 4 n=2 Tax=Sistotremastraceae TaxID=3402574 RepID=A0A164UIW0_9AGAM|nr:peroxisomal membrane protein 4 [Sistotremastrum niveocremeum HHB9708]KZT43928.1 peroxisomal membrane protein 4 [Sistotremastrum suecicum HHB10207 ss-3]
MEAINQIILDPRYHDYLGILKGARNGLVYGVKIRFPHALLMSILFGRGGWKERAKQIFKATRQHATNLAAFVTLYKTMLLMQKKFNGGKERTTDTFIAGLIGGYIVFGDRNAINEQIVLYVCSRVVASFIPRAGGAAVVDNSRASGSGSGSGLKSIPPDARLFSLFAAVCWGSVMWLFNHRGQTIQPGMYSSMRYLYQDSNRWKDLRTLLWHNT